jgi:hypothetical protein
MKYIILKEIIANGQVDHGAYLGKVSTDDPYYIYDTIEEAQVKMQELIDDDTIGRGFKIDEIP